MLIFLILVAIDEIRQLATGKDCPHVKDSKGKKVRLEDLQISSYNCL